MTAATGQAAERPAVLRGVATYLDERFALKMQGPAIVMTYTCSYLLYSHIGGWRFGWRTVVGGLTLVLLFLEMRIVDDLDDVADDGGAHGGGAGLIVGLGATLGLLVVLNLESALLPMVLGASALVIGTPFVVKRFVSRSTAVVGPFFEAEPAAVLLSVYGAWRAVSGESLSPGEVALVVGVFWSAYEFWKFGRRVGRPDYDIYGLSWTGIRSALLALLAFGGAALIGVAAVAGATPALWLAAVVIPVAFGRWVWRIDPDGGRAEGSKLDGFVGLVYVAAVIVAVLIETAARGVLR